MAVTTRAGAGRPLTYTEMDTNWTTLNTRGGIDSSNYATLQAALDSLSDGDTLFITEDIVLTSGVSSSTDNIIIQGVNGKTISTSTPGFTLVTLTGNGISVFDCKFTGSGTFVTNAASADTKGLLALEGDNILVQGCTFTDAESFSIQVKGDYTHILSNTFIGGPLFDPESSIGTDRQHYGIMLYLGDPDYTEIGFNTFQKNTLGGAAIQWIVGGWDSDSLKGTNIHDNTFERPWQHFAYVNLEGGNVSDNFGYDGALKVETRTNGASIIGNTISRNTLIFTEDPYLNKQGITLSAPYNSIISENRVIGATIYGIRLTDPFSDVSAGIVGNMILDNYVYGTKANSPVVDSIGISLEINNDNIDGVISGNVISRNHVQSTGDDTAGLNFGIYIQGDAATVSSNIGNIVELNVVDGSLEGGVRFDYLQKLQFRNNMVINVGTGATAAAVQTFHVTDSQLNTNMIDGGTGTMNYGFREDAAGANNNRYEGNTVTGYTTSIWNMTDFGTDNYVSDNSVGTKGPLTYSTAGDRALALADMYHRIHLRDPNGGNRTDTLPTLAALDQDLLPLAGSSFEILYCNTADAAETITIAGNTGVTALANEGATDLIIAQGECAKITIVRTGSTAVALVSKFS